MLKRTVGALVVLVLGAGFVFADEFGAIITKVDGNKVTFHKAKFKKGAAPEKGDEMTLPLAKDAKVTTGGRFNKETKSIEDAEDLPQGAKNERLQKIGEKGMFAFLTTDEDNKKITRIHLFAFKKKKAD